MQAFYIGTRTNNLIREILMEDITKAIQSLVSGV